jgi:hypothetical protein
MRATMVAHGWQCWLRRWSGAYGVGERWPAPKAAGDQPLGPVGQKPSEVFRRGGWSP